MTLDEFIAQYNTLQRAAPKHPTHSTNNESSEYVSFTYRSKSCFYCFDCIKSVDCIDCDYCIECELLYDCLDCYQTYKSSYLNYCARLYDSYFSWDCFDCHDIFGCTHLKQKQYCIFNKQYSKDEYDKKIKDLLTRPASEHIATLKALIKLYPFGPTNVTHSENSDYGNHVHYSKNCYLAFDTARSSDCAYTYDTAFCSTSMDLTYCYKAELCYECTDSAKIYNCDLVEWSSDCFDSSYLTNCVDCHNCFGCVDIKHKKFCILNKQYSEEEYKRVKIQLLDSRYKGDAGFDPA